MGKINFDSSWFFDFPNFYQVDRTMVGESLGAMRVLNIDEECYFWIR